jgi:spore coat polysaccharide biosynthesis predicted glycosyltransferase SpsG
MGYRQQESLTEFEGVEIRQDVQNISEEMLKADIAFTSAGRTVYELACIGTPTIVIAQNAREMTHFFASTENGFINLGLGSAVTPAEILAIFRGVVENDQERRQMNAVMLARSVRDGRERVLHLIQEAIEVSR